ncbi:hypothetical protein LCGC14_1315890 [marine sediment metagenome]|uniref:3'-phosphate/5'-hydroxy nucleic acid ligase n=1 Tax=marine sediment metagenome TaxID=412755 RepID=A0A0F9L691_9ZZZZ
MQKIPFSRLKKIFNVKTKEELVNYLTKSLGTLGQGNHFLSIEKGSDNYVWLMIHSGSRNMGNRIADYHHKIALQLNNDFASNIPDKYLAFLPTKTDLKVAENYIKDMQFALEYAYENRQRMMKVFAKAFKKIAKKKIAETINIHHNYAQQEHHYGKNLWIHRKGATSAKKGEIGIIPGSMGTSSYIVEGLGNWKSYQSCSHGAGRKMSRTKASDELTKKDCNEAMKGIVFGGWGEVSRGRLKGSADLSESPLAYKDIDEVMESQKDLVEIKVKLTPIANMKG